SEKSLEDANQILKITEEMSNQIEKEEIDHLDQSISQRQQLINKADINTNKIEEMINDYENPQEEKIINYKNHKRQIYETIYKIKKQNQRQAEKLLKDYKGKLMNLRHGKKAINTYGRRPINQSMMLNKVK